MVNYTVDRIYIRGLNHEKNEHVRPHDHDYCKNNIDRSRMVHMNISSIRAGNHSGWLSRFYLKGTEHI